MGNFKSKTYEVQKKEDQNKIKDITKRKVNQQPSIKLPDRMSKEIRDARVSETNTVATTSQAQNEMNETTETVSKPEGEEKYTEVPEQNLQSVEPKPADTSKIQEPLQRSIDQDVNTHRAPQEKHNENEGISKVQAETPVTEQKSNISSEKQEIEVKPHVAEENAPSLKKSEQATENGASVEEIKLEKEQAISESKGHESEDSLPISNINRSIILPDQKETQNQATEKATPKDEIPEHKRISKEEIKTESISNLHDISTVGKEEVKEVEVQIENVSNFQDINKEDKLHDKNKKENSIKVEDDIIVHQITTEATNKNEYVEEETKKEAEINHEPKLVEHKQSEDPKIIRKEFVYPKPNELPESQSTAKQDPIQDNPKEVLAEQDPASEANQQANVCTKEQKHELELLPEHQSTPSEDKPVTEACEAKKEDKDCSELLTEHSSNPPESKLLIAEVYETKDGLELLSEQRSIHFEEKSHAVEGSEVKKDNNLEFLVEHPSVSSEEKSHAVEGSEVKKDEKDSNLELLVEHRSISDEEKLQAEVKTEDLLLEHSPEEKSQVAEVYARKLELLSEEKPTNLAIEEPSPIGVEQVQKAQPKEQIANHVDQSQEKQPAKHTQEIHPNLTAIRNIEKEVKEMKVEILHFNGTSQDTEYLTLHEMLIRNIIKLDDIVVENNDEIRNERKRVIKFSQQCLSDLERKVENSKPGESNESDSE